MPKLKGQRKWTAWAVYSNNSSNWYAIYKAKWQARSWVASQERFWEGKGHKRIPTYSFRRIVIEEQDVAYFLLYGHEYKKVELNSFNKDKE